MLDSVVLRSRGLGSNTMTALVPARRDMHFESSSPGRRFHERLGHREYLCRAKAGDSLRGVPAAAENPFLQKSLPCSDLTERVSSQRYIHRKSDRGVMRRRDVMPLQVEQSRPLQFLDKSLRELVKKRCRHSRHLIFQGHLLRREDRH